MPDIDAILRRNLAEVEQRIAAACGRVGRARSEVTLVAVTKYVDVDIARRLLALGIQDLGESRPQELWRKAAAVPEATWHLVGHLQRNKVERTTPIAKLIHSVDSPRLLAALEEAGEKQNRTVDVLLELKLGNDPNKHGLSGWELHNLLEVPDEAPGNPAEGKVGVHFADHPHKLDALKHVHIVGFMTMAALDLPGEDARSTFTAIRRLRDVVRDRLLPVHHLSHLSMGMTNDFEVAIEEGATLVRIGSALFTGLR